jgi:hypothetical protein
MVALFDLSDINPDSVKVDAEGVVFETADASGKIHFITSSDPTMTSANLFAREGQASGDTMDNSFSVGRVNLDSAESNERLASALRHAIVLCGGTRAPF